MTSKTAVQSSEKSNNTKAMDKRKLKDGGQLRNISELEMEESSSDDEDTMLTSNMEDDEIDNEGDSGEEENAGSAEVDEDDSEGENDDDNTGDSEDEDMSEDVSDSDDLHNEIQNDSIAESGEGVDLTDSDKDNSKTDDEENMEEEGGNSDVKVAANPAWAQALAKILRTQKPTGKKAIVLSKARTIPAAEAAAAARKVDEPEFEIIGENEVKPKLKEEEDVKPTEEELILAKRTRLADCRVKHEDFDYNRERALAKIATKGVVQLFNAVRAQQKNIGSKLAEAHSTRMEEKLLNSIDKNSFLEHLTGKIKSHKVVDLEKEIKQEKDQSITLPKSWAELNKSVESGKDLHGWDRVVEIKEESDD